MLLFYEGKNRKADLLHVLCQMHSQLFPRRAEITTKAAGLVFWLLSRITATSLDNGPNIFLFTWSILLTSSPCAWPWLCNLVLSNKMLHKVILAIASMITVRNLAGPILKLSMALILVSDPVSLSFEGLWLATIWKSACERLDIFVDMLSPVRWLVELLHFETKRALEFCWQTFDWWWGNARWERVGQYGSLWWRFSIIVR